MDFLPKIEFLAVPYHRPAIIPALDRENTFFREAADFLAAKGVPTDATARQAIVEMMWAAGRRPCPACGQRITEQQAGYLARGKKLRCGRCGASWRPWAKTPLAGVHARPAELVLAAALLHHGVSPAQIAALLGRDLATVTAWIRRLVAVERPNILEVAKNDRYQN
jgi:transposase-like protein